MPRCVLLHICSNYYIYVVKKQPSASYLHRPVFQSVARARARTASQDACTHMRGGFVARRRHKSVSGQRPAASCDSRESARGAARGQPASLSTSHRGCASMSGTVAMASTTQQALRKAPGMRVSTPVTTWDTTARAEVEPPGLWRLQQARPTAHVRHDRRCESWQRGQLGCQVGSPAAGATADRAGRQVQGRAIGPEAERQVGWPSILRWFRAAPGTQDSWAAQLGRRPAASRPAGI